MEDREESEAWVRPCLVWESKVESVSRYLGPTQRNGNGPTGKRKAASTQGSIASPGKGSIVGHGALACGVHRAAIETGRVIMDGRERAKKVPHCSVHFVRKRKHGERRSGKPTHSVIK